MINGLMPVRDLVHRGWVYLRHFGFRRFLKRLISVQIWTKRLFPKQRRKAFRQGGALSDYPFGVNIVGRLSRGTGVSEAGRAVAKALLSVRVPVAINDYTIEDAAADVYRLSEEVLPIKPSNDNPYLFNLFSTFAAPIAELGWHDDDSRATGHYNIAYWAWENEVFPDSLARHIYDYDEVWVPSTFVRDAIVRVTTVPVTLVPHPISPRRPSVGRSPLLRGISEDACIFLFVVNLASVASGRKNVAGAIEAFKRAFMPQDNAWLVLKLSFDDRGRLGPLQKLAREEFSTLEDLARGANIRIIDQRLSRLELDDLLASCSAYVSLHRGEGFGLTIAEAMSLAKPVIATNYSGNTDFMTPENSHLVDYKLVPVGKGAGRYEKNWRWADPDLEQAASFMRYIHNDPDAARRVGEKARKDIVAQLAPEVIGKRIMQRLMEIRALLTVRGFTRQP